MIRALFVMARRIPLPQVAVHPVARGKCDDITGDNLPIIDRYLYLGDDLPRIIVSGRCARLFRASGHTTQPQSIAAQLHPGHEKRRALALPTPTTCDHYPVASIKGIDISPGLLSFGPSDKDLITNDGEGLSLNDIEHRTLRPIWKDPRIHYGVNCASIGCPNLPPKVFTAATLDAQLENTARTYANNARGVTISGGKITVSSIYDRFREDFGDSEAGVIKHLLAHAKPGLAAEISRIGALDGTACDWSRNGVK